MKGNSMKKLLLLCAMSIAVLPIYAASRYDKPWMQLAPSYDPIKNSIVEFLNGLKLSLVEKETWAAEIYAATVASAPTVSAELIKKRAQAVSRIHVVEEALRQKGMDAGHASSQIWRTIQGDDQTLEHVHNYLRKVVEGLKLNV